MIVFILGILFLLCAIGAGIYFLFNFKSESDYTKDSAYFAGIVGVVLLTLAIGCTIFASAYKQDPGESIVIQSAGGKVLSVDETSGFGLTAPWNKTISFNVRNQKLSFHSGKDASDAVIKAPLKGSSNADVSITVTYSINGECVGDVFNKYRTQERLEQDVLIPGIRDVVRLNTARFEPLNVKEQRGTLSNDVLENLKTKFEKQCVTINNVDLGDISLDPDTEDAIVKRNERQIEVESAAADLEKAQIQAETKKVAAKADADSDQILRCGATVTPVTRTVDGKEIQGTDVTPLSGAACENRLTPQVIEIKRLEALQAIGEKGNLIITDGSGAQPLIQVPQTPQG